MVNERCSAILDSLPFIEMELNQTNRKTVVRPLLLSVPSQVIKVRMDQALICSPISSRQRGGSADALLTFRVYHPLYGLFDSQPLNVLEPTASYRSMSSIDDSLVRDELWHILSSHRRVK